MRHVDISKILSGSLLNVRKRAAPRFGGMERRAKVSLFAITNAKPWFSATAKGI